MNRTKPGEKSVTFFSYLMQECRDLAEDKWLLSLVSWLPVLLFYLFWSIFSDGVCRNLPVGVVDHDQSVMSRHFVRAYEATPEITIESYSSETDALVDLRCGNIYGLVVLPEGLEANTVKRLQPKVTAFVNYQYMLVGKQINSALRKAHTTTVVRLATVKNLAGRSAVFESALAQAAPISVQLNTLGNSNSDYGQFLVTAMVPAAWQIMVVMSAILSFAATARRVDIRQWLFRDRVKKISAKLLPLIFFFALQGILFLWGMFGLAGWPMHGSWLLMIGVVFLTVFVCLGAGFFLYLLTCDVVRALSISAAYTAPGLAFMGVTFPVSDMNIFAVLWRNLLPISHYSEIQIAVANYGASPLQIQKPLIALFTFVLLYVPVFILARFRSTTDMVVKEVVP